MVQQDTRRVQWYSVFTHGQQSSESHWSLTESWSLNMTSDSGMDTAQFG